MGRIEEALAKLQARGSRGMSSAVPQRSIAAVRETSASTAPHGYGGKLIEVHLGELRAHGLLASDQQQSILADEYRAIKRPLLKSASMMRDGLLPQANLLMVASALPGEGKTFTSVNLSLSIAREHDWSVVLVDSDCSKRHLTESFGAGSEPGLIDLLRDRTARFESLVMPTNIERLSILPSGSPDDRATELLSSSRMVSLLADISRDDPQRMVIFDSPPLLLRPEAQILAGHVGQVLMVVQANKTPRRAALAARDRLDLSKAVTLLLNQAGSRDGMLMYGGYRGYPA